MTDDDKSVLSGVTLDEGPCLSLEELCRGLAVQAGWVITLVEEGVLQVFESPPGSWHFAGSMLRRARIALRLERDLGLNLAGVALALDLIEEVEILRARLSALSTRHE